MRSATSVSQTNWVTTTHFFMHLLTRLSILSINQPVTIVYWNLSKLNCKLFGFDRCVRGDSIYHFYAIAYCQYWAPFSCWSVSVNVTMKNVVQSPKFHYWPLSSDTSSEQIENDSYLSLDRQQRFLFLVTFHYWFESKRDASVHIQFLLSLFFQNIDLTIEWKQMICEPCQIKMHLVMLFKNPCSLSLTLPAFMAY